MSEKKEIKRKQRTKLGSASRFEARYGSKHKRKINEMEGTKKKQRCPKCGRMSLKRKGYAVWECTKCGAKIAGGAYTPKTMLGELIEKIFTKKLTKEELKKITEQIEAQQAANKPPEIVEQPKAEEEVKQE